MNFCWEEFIVYFGSFVFNVTSFSVYSAGETPVVVDDGTGGSSGGSSGGGGGSSAMVYNLSVEEVVNESVDGEEVVNDSGNESVDGDLVNDVLVDSGWGLWG